MIIPTFNEELTIVGILTELIKCIGDPIEIIVVDDNSSDATRQQILKMGDSRVILIHRTRDRGLASATLRGVIESRGATIVWIDADAWMMPPLLPEMIRLLGENDMVVASRYLPGGADCRTATRVIASRLINGFASLCLGGHVRDYTSNFVVMRRTVFDSIIPIPVGFGDFFVELVHGATCRGLVVAEVPYTLRDRREGESKAYPSRLGFLRLGLNYVYRIVKVFLKYGRAPSV